MMSSSQLTFLTERLREFSIERDWLQFHSPKNLIMALSVEVAELAEHFQWMDGEVSRKPDPDTRLKIREEMGDVFIYLLRLADELDMNLVEAAEDKINVNEEKYPADKVRGSSRKYSDYDS